MVRDYGKQQAQNMIGEAVASASVAAERQFAAREPNGPSLQSFAALQELWEKDDALKVEIIGSEATRYDYDVHRCRTGAKQAPMFCWGQYRPKRTSRICTSNRQMAPGRTRLNALYLVAKACPFR
ncbi:L-2-amino-thiazoline-4-carboxylic acid hydrolase [Pseudomonas sp. X10]